MCQVHEPFPKLVMQLRLVLDCSTARSLDIFKNLFPPIIMGWKLYYVSEVDLELFTEASQEGAFDVLHVPYGGVNLPPGSTLLARHLVYLNLINTDTDKESLDKSFKFLLVLDNVTQVTVVFFCLIFVGDEVPKNPLTLPLVLFVAGVPRLYLLNISLAHLNISGHLINLSEI